MKFKYSIALLPGIFKQPFFTNKAAYALIIVCVRLTRFSVVALYAFYNIITAVMSAAKAIKLAAALVSMLSLETAMLMQFNSRNDAETFRQVMTGATGGAVCAIVLVVAVFMIIRSCRQLKRLHSIEQ